MLHAPADFPAAGSVAFLAPTGEQVRIQRHNADGRTLISLPAAIGSASGNTTVALDRLHPTKDAAVAAGLGPKFGSRARAR